MDCRWDYVQIGNSRHCGRISKPWSIVTNTTLINLRFRSAYPHYYVIFDSHSGFLAIWTATTDPPTYPAESSASGNCVFPFTYLGQTFDTCIKVEDEDNHPWCPYNTAAVPVDEGTHAFRSYCSDSDSPSLVFTSPNHPQLYHSFAEQVKWIIWMSLKQAYMSNNVRQDSRKWWIGFSNI